MSSSAPTKGLIASEKTILDRRGWHVALRGIRTFLIGRPISTEHEEHERLSKAKALAVFSSDNISSSAYGPEEIMRVLVLAGTGALFLTVQLAVLIIVMLAIVTVSYRQTIKAYPMGASSYIVPATTWVIGPASWRLGTADRLHGDGGRLRLGRRGGHDLDHPADLRLSRLDQRGAGRAPDARQPRHPRVGTIFMTPTYLYVVVMLGVIAVGLVQAATGQLAPFDAPQAWIDEWNAIGQALGLLLILRAFSQGAVLTGVEAVSDGVPAFKPPEWKNARTTPDLGGRHLRHPVRGDRLPGHRHRHRARSR